MNEAEFAAKRNESACSDGEAKCSEHEHYRRIARDLLTRIAIQKCYPYPITSMEDPLATILKEQEAEFNGVLKLAVEQREKMIQELRANNEILTRKAMLDTRLQYKQLLDSLVKQCVQKRVATNIAWGLDDNDVHVEWVPDCEKFHYFNAESERNTKLLIERDTLQKKLTECRTKLNKVHEALRT